MKKVKEGGLLTVIDRDTGTSDNGESLQMYMNCLKKFPPLTKDEEFTLATRIRDCKRSILQVCTDVTACTKNIIALKERPIIELRKLFFVLLDEDSGKAEVLKMMAKLEASLEDKKDRAAALDMLQNMNFTLQDLRDISKPALIKSNKTQMTKLTSNLADFQLAKNTMIERNLRLVFTRAQIYANRGMGLEDLLQEGNIGLIKAIEKYDVSKGFKFSTYATWWIDQALSRAVADKSRIIRIPVHMVENINKVSKASRKLRQELGRDPLVGEISERTSLPGEKIDRVKRMASMSQSTEEPVGELGTPLSEFLVDENAVSPYEAFERDEMIAKVHQLLARLPPREEKILRMRFGIGEKKPQILNTISKEFGISKERARQLVAQGVARLNTFNDGAGELLRSYLELIP